MCAVCLRVYLHAFRVAFVRTVESFHLIESRTEHRPQAAADRIGCAGSHGSEGGRIAAGCQSDGSSSSSSNGMSFTTNCCSGAHRLELGDNHHRWR